MECDRIKPSEEDYRPASKYWVRSEGCYGKQGIGRSMIKKSDKKSLSPAVFLDRDGVLCTEKGYVTGIEELEIFPYTRKCIELLHQKGFLAVCVTNQSAVARGFMSEDTLKEINAYLVRETGIDAVYYCPHHPRGIGVYGTLCKCRKPDTGMIEKAAERFQIDRERSYMVGDRSSDILCGKKAGIKTVLLESGYGTSRLEEPVYPDFIYHDLQEFVRKIVEE